MGGIFAIISEEPCWKELEMGIEINQNRGDEFGGFAASDGKAIICEKKEGRIKQLLGKTEKNKEFTGKIISGIAHVSRRDAEPAGIKKGDKWLFCTASDGMITNREELLKESPFLTSTDTDAEVLSKLVFEEIYQGKDYPEAIENIFAKVKGAFSLALLTPERLFAARDIHGFQPLVLGKNSKGCAVSSESIALKQTGFEEIYDIRPGEIIEISSLGFQTKKQFPLEHTVCAFQFVYWARTSSVIDGIPVGKARHNAGKVLAQTNIPEIDFVASFPMSGNTATEGLAEALKIPYRNVFDYNGPDRSFISNNLANRKRRAEIKLLPIDWAIDGMRIAIVDDSVVTGNQSNKRIHLLKNAGAKEVHFRVASPEIKYPCPIDVTKRGELFANKYSKEERSKVLGVDSLEYIDINAFVEAIISARVDNEKARTCIGKNNLCLGCFTGEFPEL